MRLPELEKQEPLASQTVLVRVPASPGHLTLLRTAVGGYAARDRFTLDQVDDLRMAVEEAAVALLRHADGEPIDCEIATTGDGVRIRLSTRVASGPVIDETSFSWAILSALADEVETGTEDSAIVLHKRRLDEAS